MSHGRLISLALCSHFCIFIFQHSCSEWVFLLLDYFHLFLCLNELIYIFSPWISYCYSIPILLASTACLFYFLQGSYLYFHIICSFPYSHTNEDTCIKSEPKTNPYLIHFPFRIHFTFMCFCKRLLFSDLHAWQEVIWLIFYSLCSTTSCVICPTNPFHFQHWIPFSF